MLVKLGRPPYSCDTLYIPPTLVYWHSSAGSAKMTTSFLHSSVYSLASFIGNGTFHKLFFFQHAHFIHENFVSLLLAVFLMLECGQVQEKKVKKISDMNMDRSQVAGNGVIAGSSVSTAPEVGLPNGRCSDRPYNYSSSDFVFPPGGVPSLRLPVVVVLTLVYWFCWFRIVLVWNSWEFSVHPIYHCHPCQKVIIMVFLLSPIGSVKYGWSITTVWCRVDKHQLSCCLVLSWNWLRIRVFLKIV